MIPKTIVHLDSGGMDSTTLKYQLHSEGHKLHCLLIDYGQKHVQALPISVWAPYLDKPKSWIAGMARNLKVPLNETWSCYEGGKEPCGKLKLYE